MTSIRRLARWFVIALVGLVVVWKVVAPAPKVVVATPPQIDVDELEIIAEEEVEAGEAFIVEVQGGAPDVPVELVVDGGYHGRRFTASPEDQSAESVTGSVASFEVPAALSPESGTVQLTAIQGRRVASGTLEMIPGEAVDPLNVYLGPRTVVADTEHFSMVVAVPRDVWGNPVVDGTDVTYTVNRPDGAVDKEIVQTDGLLAWLNIFSRTKVGRTRVGIEVGPAGGVEESFLEVADIPLVYDVEVVGTLPLADGSSLVTIRTATLIDQYENPMPDGTTVFVDLDGVTGRRHLWGETIASVAEFTFEAPEVPGAVWLSATASGVTSERRRLLFAPAVTSFPFTTTETPDGLRIDIGQVRTARRAYVADGTTAWVEVDEVVSPVQLRDGLGSITLPDAKPEDVSVTVLGAQGRLDA